MRHQGKISEWNDARGFGFIVPLGGGERVFAHISSFPTTGRRPNTNEVVTYDLGRDDRGRVRAEKVTYLLHMRPGPLHGAEPRNRDLLARCVAVVFLVIVALAVLIGRLWWPVACVYILTSIWSFFAYRRDKLAAQVGTWRTKEWTLIVLGLIGGWPGALVAQQRFRHKTRKLPFQIGYWLSVAANLTALAWLLSL